MNWKLICWLLIVVFMLQEIACGKGKSKRDKKKKKSKANKFSSKGTIFMDGEQVGQPPETVDHDPPYLSTLYLPRPPPLSNVSSVIQDTKGGRSATAVINTINIVNTILKVIKSTQDIMQVGRAKNKYGFANTMFCGPLGNGLNVLYEFLSQFEDEEFNTEDALKILSERYEQHNLNENPVPAKHTTMAVVDVSGHKGVALALDDPRSVEEPILQDIEEAEGAEINSVMEKKGTYYVLSLYLDAFLKEYCADV